VTRVIHPKNFLFAFIKKSQFIRLNSHLLIIFILIEYIALEQFFRQLFLSMYSYGREQYAVRIRLLPIIEALAALEALSL
jgi:hypothetical protein